MEYKEFSAKTVQDAITEACTHFIVTSSSLEYEVVDEGSTGFLGIGSKPAVIKARVKTDDMEEAKSVFTQEEKAPEKKENKEVKKEAAPKKENKPVEVKKEEAPKKKEINVDAADVEKRAKEFLSDVLVKMELPGEVSAKYDANENCLNMEITDVKGDVKLIIGTKGQTLDSLQYLVSLVVNKGTKEYVRVKVDTENYRERRVKTLENLAKNKAFKVKRERRTEKLEPMNPYERRIIHSALQNDKYVTTFSEGEEPNRRVVIALKK